MTLAVSMLTFCSFSKRRIKVLLCKFQAGADMPSTCWCERNDSQLTRPMLLSAWYPVAIYDQSDVSEMMTDKA